MRKRVLERFAWPVPYSAQCPRSKTRVPLSKQLASFLMQWLHRLAAQATAHRRIGRATPQGFAHCHLELHQRPCHLPLLLLLLHAHIPKTKTIPSEITRQCQNLLISWQLFTAACQETRHWSIKLHSTDGNRIEVNQVSQKGNACSTPVIHNEEHWRHEQLTPWFSDRATNKLDARQSVHRRRPYD